MTLDADRRRRAAARFSVALIGLLGAAVPCAGFALPPGPLPSNAPFPSPACGGGAGWGDSDAVRAPADSPHPSPPPQAGEGDFFPPCRPNRRDAIALFRPVNVFADRDKRRFVAAGDPCAAAVGLVDADDVGNEGTGTVVAHPRIVLTAAHVVLDLLHGRVAERVTFRLGYAAGRARADIRARVAALGTTRPGTVGTARDDWAILVLDRPAPARPFELAVSTTAALAARYRGALSLIGYSGDRADGEIASIETGCSVVGERYGRFLHDCSTAEGASGAALTAATAAGCAMVGLVDGAVSRRPAARAPFRPAAANTAVMPARFRDRLLAIVRGLDRGGAVDDEKNAAPFSARPGRRAGPSP